MDLESRCDRIENLIKWDFINRTGFKESSSIMVGIELPINDDIHQVCYFKFVKLSSWSFVTEGGNVIYIKANEAITEIQKFFPHKADEIIFNLHLFR